MKILLWIIGLLALLMAGSIYSDAGSVMHQILGATIGVAGCVLIGSGAIAEAIDGIPARQARYEKEMVAKANKAQRDENADIAKAQAEKARALVKSGQ